MYRAVDLWSVDIQTVDVVSGWSVEGTPSEIMDSAQKISKVSGYERHILFVVFNLANRLKSLSTWLIRICEKGFGVLFRLWLKYGAWKQES